MPFPYVFVTITITEVVKKPKYKTGAGPVGKASVRFCKSTSLLFHGVGPRNIDFSHSIPLLSQIKNSEILHHLLICYLYFFFISSNFAINYFSFILLNIITKLNNLKIIFLLYLCLMSHNPVACIYNILRLSLIESKIVLCMIFCLFLFLNLFF